MRNWQESGQTLLIVVLVMVVSLTVGLAVVSRSITSLRSSSEEASSQAAFSAAEAGVEQALKTGAAITTPQLLGNNAQIKQVAVTSIAGTEFLLNNGNPISKDDGADVWLIEHNSDGTLNYSSGWQTISIAAKLTIYWGSSSDTCSNAALEIVVITGTASSPISTRYVYDSCADRAAENNFAVTEPGIFTAQGKNFYYREMINIPSSSRGLIVRIIPLYFNTPIAIKGCHKNFLPGDSRCNPLPAQGSIITSTGESGSTQRKITFFQGYPNLPSEFFQYVLFSPR